MLRLLVLIQEWNEGGREKKNKNLYKHNMGLIVEYRPWQNY